MCWKFLRLHKDVAIWRRPAKNGSGDLFTFTDSPAIKPCRKAYVAFTLDDIRLAVTGTCELSVPNDVAEDLWAEYRVKFHRKLRIDADGRTVRYYDKAAGVNRRGVILSRRRNRSRESLTLLLGEPINGEEKTRKEKGRSEKISGKKGDSKKGGTKKAKA